MPTVEKLVTLRLDGDLTAQGFRVTLEIGLSGDRPYSEVRAFLPPNPALAHSLNQWQQSYRNLKLLTRIKPQKILYRGSINQTENCQQRSVELRDRFCQWLQSESFRSIDQHLREELNRDEQIQVLIRTIDLQLWQLPWQMWDLIDRYPQAEVTLSTATFQRVPVSRPSVVRQQVKVLAILGHAADIDVAADQALLQALPEAEVTFLVEPHRQDLSDRLWDQAWDILFFAGHSQTEAQRGRIYINPTDSLTLDELKYGLRRAIAQGLQLAIFNSCDGLGLAQELEQLCLPQMIVMREPVPDPVAHTFLKHFLTAYAGGEPLYLAERQARERLQGLEAEFPCASWLPVICQNPAVIPPTWQSLLSESPGTSSQSSLSELVGATSQRKGDRRWSDWRLRDWRSLRRVLAYSLMITGAIVGMRGLGWLEAWELKAYDAFMRHQPAENQDDRLLIVTIDDADIQYQEQQGMTLQGSLSDQALTLLLERLQPLKPRSVGLDLYRSGRIAIEPSDLPLFTICKVPAAEGGDPYGVDPPEQIPIDQIGFSDFVADRDDVLRRQLVAIKNPAPTSRCTANNAFSLLLALHYLETVNIPYHLTPNQELQVDDVVLQRLTRNAGGYATVDAAGYQMLLHYRSDRSPETIAQTVSLRQVLESGFPEATIEQLSDRIVLIGVTAASSGDAWLTPYSAAQNGATRAQSAQKLPGVMMHAQMISQLLSAVLDGRSLIWWWSEGVEVVWIGGWTLVGGVLAGIGQSRFRLISGLIALMVLGGICYGCFLWGGWIPLVPPALALVLVLVVATSRDRKNQNSKLPAQQVA
ncbi:MAG: hypothetical protein Kow00121_50530 [Elainellaceae cyanobacterium]